MTPRRSRFIETPIGRFSYHKITTETYPLGIQLEPFEHGYFLLAGAEKALCDKLLLTRNLSINSQQDMQEFLESDIRFDMDRLATFDLAIVKAYGQLGVKTKLFKMLELLIKEMA